MKKEIREIAIEGRKKISSEERLTYSEKIVNAIVTSEEYEKAKTIMLYKAVGSEVCLETLEKQGEKTGKILAYPYCISKSEMAALSPNCDEAWTKGRYGIPEPLEEMSAFIKPEDIDMIICPCAAFDDKCNRLGMGGGYYDRFLPLCINAHVIAVAFEVQKVSAVPAEEHDIPMEKVFTEKNIYKRSKDSDEKNNIQ